MDIVSLLFVYTLCMHFLSFTQNPTHIFLVLGLPLFVAVPM